MKLSNKVSIGIVSISLLFGLAAPHTAFAVPAAAPDLGTAASFSVFGGSAMTADSSGATVSGDLGVNPGLSVSGPWTVGGRQYFGTGGLSGTAKTDATAAWTSMGSSGGTAWDPAVPADMTPVPGLYTRSGDATISTTLTLNGTASDVWIFQINSTLTFTNAATVVLGPGVNACNVFWRVASDATINGSPGKTFAGTLIANGNVSMVTGPTITGRMMALTGTLSASGITTISGCATPASGGGNPQEGSITVVKNVINDNGGTKTVADFPLFVNGKPVISGVTNTFQAPGPAYTITETSDANYTQTFSGACDSNGRLNLIPGDLKICVITNNDKGAPALPPVPPLIDVVKTASPLSLPNGPGPVTYTYTLKNIGTVPVTNVTMVGDSCSPIILASGDADNDTKLDLNETWVYRCSKTLPATHTNIVTATGWANGISATDIASATVVVGAAAVPPLIHVTKVPSTFTLPAVGGTVIYTEKISNPGTVALNNVILSDDKCAPVLYGSGDTNNNKKLDTSETWIYTCQSTLAQSTTNTAIATGWANGISATDFAITTVLVASPGLPNTGFPLEAGAISLDTILLGLILVIVVTTLVVTLRRRER